MRTLAMRGGRLLVTGLLLASSACAYGTGPGGAAGALGPGSLVQLRVENNSGGPMEVFAAGSGMFYRIGTVHPGLAGSFTVRPGMTRNGSVEFLARSATGAVLRSGPMLLAPGTVVNFGLEPHPATTTATVQAWRPAEGGGMP